MMNTLSSPLSPYLQHLSLLATEERDRFRGMPSFWVLVGLAAFSHIALISPVLFARVAEDIPKTKQVRLAFGLEKEEARVAEASATGEASQDSANMAVTPPLAKTQPRTVAVTSRPNAPINKQVQPPALAPRPTIAASPRSSSAVMTRPNTGSALGNNTASRGYQGDIAGSPQGEIVSKYEQLLSGWINSHRLNQILTLPAGTQGRVVVRLRINRRGYVIFKTIEQSSGIAALDKAAIDVVTRASPVPPVPQEYPGGGQVEFLIPINFVVN